MQLLHVNSMLQEKPVSVLTGVDGSPGQKGQGGGNWFLRLLFEPENNREQFKVIHQY